MNFAALFVPVIWIAFTQLMTLIWLLWLAEFEKSFVEKTGTLDQVGHTISTYHDIQMKGIEFLRGVYAASGLCIKPKTKPSRIEMLKEMVRALGLNPEEILTKEALSMPHRTVITAGRDENQIETLLKALKQKLKQELAETPMLAPKTV